MRLKLPEQISQIDANVLDAVYAIGRATLPEHWRRQSLQQVLTHGYELRVCRDNASISAYLLSQDIVDETHIMQIAVLPACRRCGLATALTQQLLRDKQHMRAICLEVRASNHAAQMLYEHCGFIRTGIRKGYYAAHHNLPREDAILMQYAYCHAVAA